MLPSRSGNVTLITSIRLYHGLQHSNTAIWSSFCTFESMSTITMGKWEISTKQPRMVGLCASGTPRQILCLRFCISGVGYDLFLWCIELSTILGSLQTLVGYKQWRRKGGGHVHVVPREVRRKSFQMRAPFHSKIKLLFFREYNLTMFHLSSSSDVASRRLLS